MITAIVNPRAKCNILLPLITDINMFYLIAESSTNNASFIIFNIFLAICLRWSLLKQTNWFPREKSLQIYTKLSVHQLEVRLSNSPSWDGSEESKQLSRKPSGTGATDHHNWGLDGVAVRIHQKQISDFIYIYIWRATLWTSSNYL